MTDPRVLLIGMMGAGKTTVGHELSARTCWPYFDNDQLVAMAVGETTPDLLRDRGENALREAESAALTVALERQPPLIASCAGGVVLDAHDRNRLKTGGFVVWLRARIETLTERVEVGEARPWLAANPSATLTALARSREPLYAEVASYVVDVDVLTPAEVASQIIDALATDTG